MLGGQSRVVRRKKRGVPSGVEDVTDLDESPVVLSCCVLSKEKNSLSRAIDFLPYYKKLKINVLKKGFTLDS